MGCTFIIIFLQLFTAIGIGKSTASISYFIQYLCLNIASQYSLSERMCALLWNYREIETCPQGRLQDLVPLYPLDCELSLPLPQSLFLTAWQPMACIGLGCSVLADALIASSMCWYLYHKRTGFARHEFIFSTFMPQFWPELRIQNRFHDHDLDAMSYCISSGLLTWWDLERPRSHTLTHSNSILTTGVLFPVRDFPGVLPFLPCLMLRLVLNPTLLYDLANILLANG